MLRTANSSGWAAHPRRLPVSRALWLWLIRRRPRARAMPTMCSITSPLSLARIVLPAPIPAPTVFFMTSPPEPTPCLATERWRILLIAAHPARRASAFCPVTPLPEVMTWPPAWVRLTPQIWLKTGERFLRDSSPAPPLWLSLPFPALSTALRLTWPSVCPLSLLLPAHLRATSPCSRPLQLIPASPRSHSRHLPSVPQPTCCPAEATT